MGNRHHYVSQVYLRRFEAAEGKVWLYDKDEERVVRPGPTATINVGQEKGFYELPANPEHPDDDPEIIEKQLAAFEAEFVDSMDVAVRIADEGGQGNLDERARLAKTIAFQHLRTRAWRDRMSATYKASFEQVLNAAWELAREISGQERPAVRSVVEVEEERARALQAQAMWSNDTINKLALRISYSIWIIALNHSDRPFVTSDSPVAAETVAAQETARPESSNPYERIIKSEGWPVPGGVGTQTFFPLTPRHALIMLDPAAFPEAVERQGQVLCVKRATVDQINAAQVAYCQRWIYASSEDFSSAVPPSNYANLPADERRLKLPV